MSAPADFTPAFATIFRAVLQASWQGSLAIVLVLLARRAFGTRVPARWHYLLWFLVLARLLVPTVVLPHSPASLENISALAHPFERPPAVLKHEPPTVDPRFAAGFLPAAAPSFDAGSTRRPAAPPPVFRPAWSPWVWAAWVWLGGVFALAGWLAACVAGLRRRLRRETHPVEESVLAIWRACCERWLRRTPPRLLAADWVDSPALVGWRRPTLLIPRRSLAAFSAQDWEHVFAHEIAHLRWRDHWSQLLLLAAWCVHWFNPVVWLGLRRLRADRELAADEWVLRHLEEERALVYGETLFKTLAGRPARLAFQPGMVGISEDGAQMKQRLRRIAAFLPGRRLHGSLAGMAAVALLATVVLGQSAAEPAATPQPNEASKGKESSKTETKPAAISIEALAAEAQNLSEGMLAAARAGDAAKVSSLVNASFSPPPAKFSEEAATKMLAELVRNRELSAFTVLHDQFKQTNYGKDWKPDGEMLASLVKDGRTDFLDVLLARRLDLDRLRAAAKSADGPTAEWIARRVAEVAKQRADLEALEKAAGDGDLAAIGRLLDSGVDVNGVGKDDNTPLLRAVSGNRLEAAQLLLDRGAQVDKPRFPGWDYTPLCLVDSVPMAELLKKNGANLHARLWGRDVNILVYVAEFGKPEVVEWFLQQGLDPKMIGDNNENLLFDLKEARTAKLLLDAGVDPNHVNEFGVPPICSARSAEVAQALIDHGAKLTGFKEPLLPRMVQFSTGGAVEAALKAGADHDPVVLQKALISAAHMDKSDIAQVLLKHGAKANEPGIWGKDAAYTILPLEVCCVFDHPKTAQVLLDAGADPNGGPTPGFLLETAMSNGHKDMTELLRKAGARNVSDLSYAVVMQDESRIQALLASAPGYAENAGFWKNVLTSAAQVGDVRTVRAALEKGVPPSIGSKEDAYVEAAREGQDEALGILLATRKPGDDPDRLQQALWNAVWNSHPYKEQRTVEHFENCVRMLLAAGARAAGDKDNNTLVRSAVFTRNPGGNPAVMEMLVRAGADPNPASRMEGNPKAHLLDAVQEACAKGQCSAPVMETLVKLNHLTKPPADGEPVRPAVPGPAVPDPSVPAEKPPATPAASRGISTSGHVSMADGSPLAPERITARIYWNLGRGGTYVASEHTEGGSFPLRLDEDATVAIVAVEQKGCAAVFTGPFNAASFDKLNDLQIKLTRGYTGAVQVTDAAGHPVAGARLHPYYPGPPPIDLDDVITDASGSAAIEHVGEAPLNIRVRADGFQADELAGLHLDAAMPRRCTLKPTTLLHGTVVVAATGQPVSGAVIKLAGVRGPQDETHYDPKEAPVVATSDGQGRFTLGSLRPDSRYYLFVEASGHGGAYLQGVTLAQGELNVTLGPELFIRGKIIHAPPSVVHMGKVHLQYGQSLEFGDNYSAESSKDVDLQTVNGEAEFSVGPFYKVSDELVDAKTIAPRGRKPVGLYVDSWARAEFSIDELPVPNFVFDLAEESNADRAPKPDAPAAAATSAKTEPASTPAATAKSDDAKPVPVPSPAAAALPYTLDVTPALKKAFHDGDAISIRAVTGTAANFQVGGTYRVAGVCRQESLKNALLYLGNTAVLGGDAIAPAAGSSLEKALPTGSTEFDFTFTLLRPGTLHLTIYDLDNPDKNDNSYAGIELGVVGVEH